ncbi:MAG: hypothetical protein ACP5NX_02545 [Candidatus Bilamarchaeaceae archaeon]
MCRFCGISGVEEYKTLMGRMGADDSARLASTREIAEQKRLPLQNMFFSSFALPTLFTEPMLEARAAYAVPNNYFQNLHVNGERCGVHFSHGSMRSVFFSGKNGKDLVLFSKNVNRLDGREFFTSFVLAGFSPGEFSYRWEGKNLTVSVDKEKPMRNLITGKTETARISFNLISQDVTNRIVTGEKVLTSAAFRNVYDKYGAGGAGVGAGTSGSMHKIGSIDMEGYAITVPHFSPHPYLLQLKGKLGFATNREMQEHVSEYLGEKFPRSL